MYHILILGAGSYIGTSFQMYMEKEYPGECIIERVSLRGEDWKTQDWSGYDSIINVAGKAHADIGGLAEEEKQEYYKVNCELACEAAEKAIADGAGQYIYFSSVIIYGDSSNSRKPVQITPSTVPSPSNFYGDSKWQAEQKLRKIFAETSGGEGAAKLVILRPPMIYGPGCKGNYRTLEKMAKKLPVFPDYPNQRSMLYIGNLCEFLYLLIQNQESGTFFPQNREYVKTAELIKLIGMASGKKIHLSKILSLAVHVGKAVPGRPGGIIKKAFGSLTYDQSMSEYKKGKYQKYSLEESVRK